MKPIFPTYLIVAFLLLTTHISAQETNIPDRIVKALVNQNLEITSKKIDWSFDGELYTAQYKVLSYPAVTKIDTSASIIFSRYSIDLDPFPQKLMEYLIANGYHDEQFNPKTVVIRGISAYSLEFKKEELVFDSDFNFIERIER